MILDQVNEKIKVNMKSGNPFVVTTLKGLKSELETNSKMVKPVSEMDVVILYKNKLVKSLDAYVGKFDKQKEIQSELDIVQEFLPKQMSDDTVDSLIKEAGSGLGDNANMGSIMKAISPIVKGKYDGKKLCERVKIYLK
jgi:hypothetical protein